ncbi:MAG TPA: prepilin-type N-terminal cleavage/methylation domain-containing protein [Candidatus Paceibacterota bacterium]
MFLKNKQQKGFTLVELLVVIAIIGILSAVVYASLNTARERGRDAKRIGDLNNVRLALEFYFDDNGEYPATLAPLVTAGHLPVVPADPNGDAYSYASLETDCSDYHLGATLEGASNAVLDSDSDAAAGSTVCTGSAVDFAGDEPIYDLKP